MKFIRGPTVKIKFIRVKKKCCNVQFLINILNIENFFKKHNFYFLLCE